MSKNISNDHSVSIPATWSLPKFAIGQFVVTETSPPYKRRKQGMIVGIEYFNADSLWVKEHHLDAGWHYSIQVDGNVRLYCREAVIWK
ncbi:MAG: hypothetical protein F6K36_14690 [Symploca sp. SIO3C6]|uniref:Uncharacterized protein n=1 Tax=Symploca sp. SIO1C4 TaxID=2607765 RepID=A0A6B3NEE5_9CYAN|nr:hypothetical protein [Symploca sp. SIO3C6]NER27528.1 hypothetical protein [Symploca sp. SIO1C4]